MSEIKKCKECGAVLPYWNDIATALEQMLDVEGMPLGLKPMIRQAIEELREERKDSAPIHGFLDDALTFITK